MSDSRNNEEGRNLGPAEYLCYRILAERHQQDNSETGRTKFFKLSTLAARRLKDEYEVDAGLPRHWYMYGEVIEEPSINQEIAFRPSANHQQGQAYYPARAVSEEDFNVDEGDAQAIIAVAQQIVEEHGEKDRQELEEFQYEEFAPNEFIVAYSDLRWYLTHLCLDDDENCYQLDLGTFSGGERSIEGFLDQMFKSFPEEYESVYDAYLTWDDTMRMLLEQRTSPEKMKDFLEFFIEKLSQIELRFRYSHNIPPERIKAWEEGQGEHITELSTRIKRERTQLLDNRPRSGTLQQVGDELNETMVEEIRRS